MAEPLPPDIFDALKAFSTAAICNAIEGAKLRLRNEGYMNQTIVPRVSPRQPMLGYALTLQMRTDMPPASGAAYTDSSAWWDILSGPPFPKIVVIEDVGHTRGVGAVTGETHLRIFKALGACGLVTNGAVRDLGGLRALGLPVYSTGVVASHGYAHVVGVGNPVTVGGLGVETGDLLHGDVDGIVKIPLAVAADLPRLASALIAAENDIFALCREPGFSVARLRAALAAQASTRQEI
ncbi:MAG: RraA family protein [Rhodospirillaceae bacterium]